MEIWKVIKGFENYQISNFGNIKSIDRFVKNNNKDLFLKGVIRKQTLRNGYYRVSLSVNGKITTKTVHRLVAQEFIPNTKNKPCVNHINGIKTDNSLANLEWCTYSENIIHGFNTGLYKRKKHYLPNEDLTLNL